MREFVPHQFNGRQSLLAITLLLFRITVGLITEPSLENGKCPGIGRNHWRRQAVLPDDDRIEFLARQQPLDIGQPGWRQVPFRNPALLIPFPGRVRRLPDQLDMETRLVNPRNPPRPTGSNDRSTLRSTARTPASATSPSKAPSFNLARASHSRSTSVVANKPASKCTPATASYPYIAFVPITIKFLPNRPQESSLRNAALTMEGTRLRITPLAMPASSLTDAARLASLSLARAFPATKSA
jgi:hypothetical protein